jgi:phosphoribosylaminoimidazole-succinocarboxamide synthase
VIPAERLDARRVRVAAVELIPLEVIVRNRATGSFVRRYGRFVREGEPLEGLVELTLKDDALEDPLIVEETVRRLGLASADELNTMRRLAQRINRVLHRLLAGTKVEVWDFKVEFARYRGGLVLRDEISPRTARFRTPAGSPVPDGVVLATLLQSGPPARKRRLPAGLRAAPR